MFNKTTSTTLVHLQERFLGVKGILKILKMKFRTGDIFVYSSVDFNDLLAYNTIGLDPGHSALVLCGKDLESVSAKGPSPTDTYVAIYPSHIWPVEYFIYKFWYEPTSTSITLLRRMTGRDISGKEALDAWLISLTRERNVYVGYQRKIMAFFKLNEPEAGTVNSCSELTAILLQLLELISPDAIVQNILPNDLYNLQFYQTVKYHSEKIFDKKLSGYEWLLTVPFIQLGWISPKPIECQAVENILSGYKPPKR